MKTAVFLVAALLAAATGLGAEPGGYIDNSVVIVLDASGSMATKMQSGDITRMQAAKNALLDVLQTIPQNTHVGILVFSSRNVKADWIYPLGGVDVEKLSAAVILPQPGGSTPLGRYIKKGADALLARRSQQFGYGTYRLIVVTDGEAGDAALVERFVPDVMSRGITIDAIGVDMVQDHTLATQVHSYRRADDPDALTMALVSVFAEISSDALSDATPEEAFDEIAAIPNEIAAAMLNALVFSGNHPIGEQPGAAPPGGTDPSVVMSDTGQAQPAAAQTPNATTQQGSGRSLISKVLGLALVVVVLLVIVAAKGLKRK